LDGTKSGFANRISPKRRKDTTVPLLQRLEFASRGICNPVDVEVDILWKEEDNMDQQSMQERVVKKPNE
jgi:hypothetical protein